MSERALAAGSAAFGRGLKRTANPYDGNSEDWMCWRDGFEQAAAAANHLADATVVRAPERNAPADGPRP